MPDIAFISGTSTAASTVAVSAIDGTGLSKGDILAATANNALGKIALGVSGNSSGHLGVGSSGLPVWTNTRERIAQMARGILAEPAPPWTTNGTAIPTANAASGTMQLCLVGLRAGDTVTNIVAPVQTAGTALTFVKMGLFNSTGGFIAATASVSASFNGISTPAAVVTPLTSAYSVTADGGYYLGFLQYGSGATGATLLRFVSNSATDIAYGSGVRGHASVTNQTDISADVVLANVNANTPVYLACS